MKLVVPFFSKLGLPLIENSKIKGRTRIELQATDLDVSLKHGKYRQKLCYFAYISKRKAKFATSLFIMFCLW